jgi:Kef-type K+ transport system membrane component KefB
MDGPFTELAVLLLICALAGAVFVRLRQPVLIAYIVVGVLVGPTVFGRVTAHDQIDLLAQVGVAVLLFAVGLTFSSNIIIVKLQSDKREMDSLLGRIAVGFLIVQDLAVVMAMSALRGTGAESGNGASLVFGKHGKSATKDVLLGCVTHQVLSEGQADVLVSTAHTP